MKIIGDLFYILLFVTMAGSLLTLLACFLGRVLRLPVPLWLGICCMAAYVVPIAPWGTHLIPPQEPDWVEGYSVLCRVWAMGIPLLVLLRGIRSFLGFQAFKCCRPCEDIPILDCCNKCARLAGLKNPPSVFWGELKNPACMLGVMRPAVILNKAVAGQLTEHELTAVLCHEMTHIKRKHMALGSVFDYVCIINWLNPLAWIMKQEFSALCEMDCDSHTTAALAGYITAKEYASSLLKLLALSPPGGRAAPGMGALGFFPARRRIRQIMARRKGMLLLAGSAAGILGLILAALFSLHLSRGYFYPYLSGPTEYAAAWVSAAHEGTRLPRAASPGPAAWPMPEYKYTGATVRGIYRKMRGSIFILSNRTTFVVLPAVSWAVCFPYPGSGNRKFAMVFCLFRLFPVTKKGVSQSSITI